MHPIEHLRHVARASGAPQRALVREAASAVGSFARDPAALVTVCRRLVSRQPSSGPLVWLSARLLTATDVRSEAWDAVEAIENDTSTKELERAIPDESRIAVLGWPERIGRALPPRGDVRVMVIDTLREGSAFASRLIDQDVDALDVPIEGLAAAVASVDLLVIEASAIGPTECLSIAGTRAAAAVAKAADIPVWLLGGVGYFLPQRMWDGLIASVEMEGDVWDLDDEAVPLSLVTAIVGAEGVQPVDEALKATDCPVTPELFSVT